jgi:hypothetical protein
MSDAGQSNWLYDTSATGVAYDPASTGGPSGATGAQSGTFDWNSLATTFGGIVHSLGDIFHTSPDAPATTTLPNYTTPPPPASSAPPWYGELTDFSKPTPYVAAGAFILLIAAINAAGGKR